MTLHWEVGDKVLLSIEGYEKEVEILEKPTGLAALGVGFYKVRFANGREDNVPAKHLRNLPNRDGA